MATFRYVVHECLWMAQCTLRLLAVLSTGIYWIVQMSRLIIYSVFMLLYFLPHIWWYLTSPSVIRRVNYRTGTGTGTTAVCTARQGPAAPRRSRAAQGSARRSVPSGPPPIGGRNGSPTLDARHRRPPVAPDLCRPKSVAGSAASVSLQGRASLLPSSSVYYDSVEDDDDLEDEESMPTETNNRATLDVVLPVPLDVVMMSLDYSNRNGRLRRKKFPVAILVTGGAWIIGSQLWGTMLARVLASRGYVVFCPDYRNFPQTDMEGMTLDVSDAIGWVLRNAGRYNGDLDDVTVVGQSAGAHLTMMSLLSQAHLAGYEAKGGQRSGLPPPSDVAYNVPRYVPRQTIHRYIGLSGIYNLEQQMSHLHQKGLNRAVLCKLVGGKEKLPRYSINSYFDPRRLGETGEVLPDNIFDFLPEKMFFLHGDADETSLPEDCASLVMTLRAAQCAFSVDRARVPRERRRHEDLAGYIVPGLLSSSSESESESDSDDCSRGDRTSSSTCRSCSARRTEPGCQPASSTPSRSSFGMTTDGAAPAPTRSCRVQQRESAAADPPGTPRDQSVIVEGSDAGGLQIRPASSPRRCRRMQQPTGLSVLMEPIVWSTAPYYADPLPECEISFLLIPGGRHTDGLVEECLSAGRSCCADFLCDYDASDSPAGADALACAALLQKAGATTPFSRFITRELFAPQQRCAAPDGLLPLAVPPEERGWLMRWCSSMCPF
eukprot:gene988-583_t